VSRTAADATLRPSRLAKSALYVALLTLGAILFGALGAATGLLAPLLGFLVFAAAIVLGSILSLLLGLIALVVTRARAAQPARPGRRDAVAATAIGAVLVVVFALLAARGGGVPAIHDVTTDPNDPPQFVASARAAENQGRDLTYPHGKGDVTALQRAAYPDLEPIRLDVPPDETLRRAQRAAGELGWKVVEVDESAGRLEANATSRIFRFVDDIVVRVRPDAGGSIVDVRSTSRVGESDLGANAARITAFSERLVGQADG
jgi:uncharacterized protein (DUF1499 family)